MSFDLTLQPSIKRITGRELGEAAGSLIHSAPKRSRPFLMADIPRTGECFVT